MRVKPTNNIEKALKLNFLKSRALQPLTEEAFNKVVSEAGSSKIKGRTKPKLKRIKKREKILTKITKKIDDVLDEHFNSKR